MKFFKYTLIIFSIFLFSCTSTNTFEKQVQTSVKEQLEWFPGSRLQDLYKNFFQDRFGPGHLIPDSAAAGNYIRRELDSYTEKYLPLIEYIGWENNFCRVSTDVLKLGYVPYQVYLESLLESANETIMPPMEDWNDEWNKILAIIERMNLNLPDYEQDKEKIQTLINSGKYMMHHSEAFSEIYDPHYRIIRKDIFLEKIQPYLTKEIQ